MRGDMKIPVETYGNAIAALKRNVKLNSLRDI